MQRNIGIKAWDNVKFTGWMWCAIFFGNLTFADSPMRTCSEVIAESFALQYPKVVVKGLEGDNRDLRFNLSEYSDGDLEALADLFSTYPASDRTEILKALKLSRREKASIDLKTLLSPTASELTNKSPPCDGPNCHNATLMWHVPEFPMSFSNPKFISSILDTHFKNVPLGSPLQVGDVVAIKDKKNELWHTAIYVAENIVWQKTGTFMDAKYEFATLDEMFASYKSDAYEVKRATDSLATLAIPPEEKKKGGRLPKVLCFLMKLCGVNQVQ